MTTDRAIEAARAALLRDGPMDVVADIWQSVDVVVSAVLPIIAASERERIAERLVALGRSDAALIVREWV